MDLNLVIGAVSLLIGILYPTLSYLKLKGARNEIVDSAKKESVSTFARIITEKQVKLDTERIREYLRSKERQYNLKNQLVQTSKIIEIFEDIERGFIENFFIPQQTKEKLIKEVNRIKSELRKITRLERKEPTASEILTLLSYFIIPAVFILIGLALINDLFIQYFNFSLPIEPLAVFTAVAGIIIGYIIVYVVDLSEEKKEIKSEKPIFEDIVYLALKELFGIDNIDREKVTRGEIVDFLVKTRIGTIPIEVKYGDITYRSLKKFIDIKSKLRSKRAMLITNSFFTNNAKKLAVKNNILLIENVKNEDDLISKLSDLIESEEK